VSITRYVHPQTVYTDATNASHYWPSGTNSGVGFNTKGATSVTLITHREAETGTSTIQAFFEFFMEAAGTTGGSWYPLLDLSNATAVQAVIYANSEVDTSTPYHRFTTLRDQNRLTTAADNVVAVNTVHKYYNIWIPEIIRIRFDTTGTTITNTIAAELLVHTVR
jgi:hypothetical protein